MAAILKYSCSGKLSSVLSALQHTNRVFCVGVISGNVPYLSNRTLLSDAYHANDKWINRERIVVDMDEMKINLDRAFFDLKEPVMSVELHKYIDNVYDKEELDVAESYLFSYRHSPAAHHLRKSTVHSWIRLCMELGHSDQALRALQNKRDCGLFPDHFTYNLLLDTFLRAGNIKGACDVAMVMMHEETLEDCPLSQLLALYACHQYLQTGNVLEEEEWNVGMTLADATRGQTGTLAKSYHAIGYTMTGRLDKAVDVLVLVSNEDEVEPCVAREAVEKVEAALNSLEEPNEELINTFKTAVSKLEQQSRIFQESLDSLIETQLVSRLPNLEQKDIDAYLALLEGWQSEHMQALERQRLAEEEFERKKKEERLDRLLRSSGGVKYWADKIQEAKERQGGGGKEMASQTAETSSS